MSKKCNAVRNKPIPEAFKGKVYLDPTYDPAFKELFDNEDALKDFLNGVLELEGDEMIKELRFRFEKPVEFRVPQRKKVIFDIFATTGSGRFLNIEIQRLEHDYFIDRTILYKAFLVIKGRKEMEESAEFKALPKKERENAATSCRKLFPSGFVTLTCPARKTNTGMSGLSTAGTPSRTGWRYRFQRKISIFSLASPTSRSPPTK